jgi:hypothetical protein
MGASVVEADLAIKKTLRRLAFVRFGTIGWSLFLLFQIMTLESWSYGNFNIYLLNSLSKVSFNCFAVEVRTQSFCYGLNVCKSIVYTSSCTWRRGDVKQYILSR